MNDKTNNERGITMLPMSAIEINNGQLKGLPKNPRLIKNAKYDKLKESITNYPEMLSWRSLLVYPLDNGKYIIVGGNMRYRAMKELRHKEAPVFIIPKETPIEKIKAYTILDNNGFGEWDWDLLANEWETFELDDWGVDVWNSNPDWEGDSDDTDVSGTGSGSQPQSLNDRFIIPPFSILDTRKGYWQDRKKKWRNTIGDMGESRNDILLSSPEVKYKNLYLKTREHRKTLGISFSEYLDKYVSEEVKQKEAQKVLSAGVSLFDPVLVEIICKWFTPYKGAKIFDCFAGDTQKGLVFGMCGYEFKGIELRQEQVDVNNKVIADKGLPISYVCDDGQNVAKYFDPESQDLLFSCPPYFDLEVYSDMPNDASNQDTYEDFIAILRNAFSKAIACLKENRFAVIVVGDVRNKKSGGYYNFVDDVKRIFCDSGMILYNELILIETGASTALRASRYMDSRKVAKMHQNVLVFLKGNPKQIPKEFPRIKITDDEKEVLEDIIENDVKQRANKGKY